MSKIEIESYNLEIKRFKDKDNLNQVVAQIRPSVAFNEDFIEDLKAKGVKEYDKRDKNGEYEG